VTKAINAWFVSRRCRFRRIDLQKRLVREDRNSQCLKVVRADLIGDREETAFLRLCLAVLGENVFDELGAQRVKPLVRLFVQINVQVSCDWVLARIGRFRGRIVTFFAIRGSQWDGADAGRLVAEAGVADWKSFRKMCARRFPAANSKVWARLSGTNFGGFDTALDAITS
jgi:hypothetical protein